MLCVGVRIDRADIGILRISSLRANHRTINPTWTGGAHGGRDTASFSDKLSLPFSAAYRRGNLYVKKRGYPQLATGGAYPFFGGERFGITIGSPCLPKPKKPNPLKFTRS